jgi:hypothetical protein
MSTTLPTGTPVRDAVLVFAPPTHGLIPHHRSQGYDLDQQCSNSFVLARRCRRSGDAEPQDLRHVRLPMIDADVLTSPSAVWL